MAAAQHLAANQRAVLMLREVLGFSAKETATMLDTSVAVGQQRPAAGAGGRRGAGARAQPAGDAARARRQALRRLIDRYVDAWERCDVAAFTELLVEDATFAMPPLATWYTPRDTIAAWAAQVRDVRGVALAGGAHERQRAAGARLLRLGRARRARICRSRSTCSRLRGELVSDVTAFIVRSTDEPDEPEAYVQFPEQPMDAAPARRDVRALRVAGAGGVGRRSGVRAGVAGDPR